MISRNKVAQIRHNRIVLFAWVILGVLIWRIMSEEREKVYRREHSFSMTKGVILGIESGAKGSQYLMYRFQVRGKQFVNGMNIDFCKECNFKCCKTGDSVKVKYETNDPSNSRLTRE
jgi:hypothetical protein